MYIGYVLGEIGVVDQIPATCSKAAMNGSTVRDISFASAPGPSRAGRIRRMCTGSVPRKARALAACGVLAAAIWPGIAPAAEAFEQVLALVVQERYSEARRQLDPLLQRDPTRPRLRLVHGILRAREGRSGDAIAIFERLRDDQPHMFEPYNNLAVLYADQDRLDVARGALIAALERRPDPVVYANLGDVYTRLARRAYARARDIRTQGADAEKPVARADPIPVPKPAPRPGSKEPGVTETALIQPGRGAAPGPAAPDMPRGPGSAALSKPVSEAALSGECVSAGSFRTRAAATRAAEWLQSQGAEIIAIGHEERSVTTRHWVYLPASPSRKAAAESVAELRAKGVRDVAVARKRGQGFVASLGVFGKEGNMRRRVAQMKKLGYSVTASPIARTVGAYVVRARAGTARTAFDGAWTSKFPGRSIGYVDCQGRN